MDSLELGANCRSRYIISIALIDLSKLPIFQDSEL